MAYVLCLNWGKAHDAPRNRIPMLVPLAEKEPFWLDVYYFTDPGY